MAEPTEPITERSAPACIECGRAWLDGSERWRLYLTSDDPAEAVMYCSDCGKREFG